ncbi:MAG: arginine--tRNA ligase [Deltaproteobacteria bacterium]|nr:arginine--tRNA ligase [Deltaproteobacteria bacterium]
MRLSKHLADLASSTLQSALGLDERPDPLLRPADPKHGDYQLNAAMALAKKLGRKPRDIAEEAATELAKLDAIASADVAGPGFINLRLEEAWLAARLTESLSDPKLGVDPVDQPETIVVDFSSPNTAKEMHIGHIRSTIIGYAIVQLLREIGHEVIGDNHLGDWGTQFGLLIVGLREWGDEAKLKEDGVAELERIYKLASAKKNEDEAFADAARAALAELQQGDPESRALWERFMAITREAFDAVYARLGVTFDEWLGESAYQDRLEGVVGLLQEKGLAKEDQGALGVFFQDLGGELPKSLRKVKTPFIVRKKDGAFNYGTTDVATILYRKERWNADRSVYVVDTRQGLHFQQLFEVAKRLGVEMELTHVGFGKILGPDGKPLRTRDGGVPKLMPFLDEAVSKARERIEEGRESGRLRIADEDVDEAVKVIGIGAVKYADLMQNRTTDYRFDPEKLIEFKGQAGPYMQFQVARIRSIFEKGGETLEGFSAPILLDHDREKALARVLARYPDAIHAAAETYQPHLVCDHVYEVATAFSGFYDDCPVLDAEGDARASRLALCALSEHQLAHGLGLLGIGVLDKM